MKARAALPGDGDSTRADRPWLVLGALLTAAFLAQALAGWRWDSLAQLQQDELYKQLTGLALVTLIVSQWRLSVTRMHGQTRASAALLATHRQMGVLAPLLLYVHAIGLGHAYIRVMSAAFLALIGLGLAQPAIARLRRGWVSALWLVTHVGLAALLVLLVGYHAFNAFYYE